MGKYRTIKVRDQTSKGIDIKSYLKVAYHDIPIVVPSIRDFWMPQRVAEVSR